MLGGHALVTGTSQQVPHPRVYTGWWDSGVTSGDAPMTPACAWSLSQTSRPSSSSSSGTRVSVSCKPRWGIGLLRDPLTSPQSRAALRNSCSEGNCLGSRVPGCLVFLFGSCVCRGGADDSGCDVFKSYLVHAGRSVIGGWRGA